MKSTSMDFFRCLQGIHSKIIDFLLIISTGISCHISIKSTQAAPTGDGGGDGRSAKYNYFDQISIQ